MAPKYRGRHPSRKDNGAREAGFDAGEKLSAAQASPTRGVAASKHE